MAEFKDHFSGHSADYAKYRPGYPEELFEWLASRVRVHDLAWDVGTGSGQAARGLARHFRRVIASDAAAPQIRNAAPHERITYKVMPAEHTDLADGGVDLVTVAQALHWFDFERFYAEANRVLKADGVIAAWTYGLTRVSAEVDAIVRRYYTEIVGPYWPPERKYVDQNYQTVPFPFAAIDAPPFALSVQWTLEDLLGYLGTWSATRRYVQAHGRDPLDVIRDPLGLAWGGTESARLVTWPLSLRVGKRPDR